jgi:hypothetical protein
MIELKGKAPLSVNLAATASPPNIRPITVQLPRAPFFNWILGFPLLSSLSSSRNNLFNRGHHYISRESAFGIDYRIFPATIFFFVL